MSDKRNANSAMDPAGIQYDVPMSYNDYLQLDMVLNAQKPMTDMHDEMLFIVQHQTSELWIRLALHELHAARESIQNDRFEPAFKQLSRIAKIFEQLNNAWDVLRTMTPSEYTQFREELGQSSGFQSWQYRLVEFIVGNRNPAMLKSHVSRPDILQKLEQELALPSLYDEAIRALSRSGFAVNASVLKRDTATAHQCDDSVIEAWKVVYQDPETHWVYYALAEKLVDFEDYFRRWRFNHVTTVERIIGFKRGTGGSEGVGYLKKMLATELFPELWRVRTVL